MARELLRIKPDIPIILCSGFNDRALEEKARHIGIKKYCIKPLDRRMLATTVREVLDEQRH